MRILGSLTTRCTLGVLLLRILLLASIIFCTGAEHITREGVFARLNYGVVFRQRHLLRLVTDTWTHVFISQLPEPPNINDRHAGLLQFNCSDVHMTATACKSFQPLFNTLLALHEKSVQRVRSVIQHIYTILPENYNGRQTRGLFDLGGQILNSLFGVATEQQVNALRDTARHTVTNNANAFHQWQKHADTMSSFMSVANQRFDNIANVIRNHDTLIRDVYSTASRLSTDIHILKTIVNSAINNITNFITVLNELEDIRIAMEDLVHGQLSPILLPPQILEHAITNLHDYLLENNYRLYTSILLGKTAAAYYRLHNFIAARQGNKLLIAVNFPLSSAFADFTLYEIQSFPVPVPGRHNSDHVTEITNLPFGVAFHTIAKLHEYLIFTTKPDVNDNHFLFATQESHPLRIFSEHNTCVSALLQNDRTLITSLCQFHLRPQHLTPQILPLTPSTILVTNISTLTYMCKRKRTVTDGCLQCEMTAPCHCSIHTSVGFIPPRLTGCVDTEQNITIYHTVNLAVLQSFFDDEHLGSLLGNTRLDRPLPVELPKFRIFTANDTSRLAKDSKFSYDLSRAVNITKADGKVFHSLAETLWHDAETFNTIYTAPHPLLSWNNWTSPIYFFNLALTILASIGTIYLLYRVKLLAATVATMHVTVHKVAALNPTLPTFISFFTPFASLNTTTPSTLLERDQTNDPPSATPYLFLLCLILLTLLLFKKFRRCTANPNSCTLILEFGNRFHTLPVDCQTLPGSPDQYIFSTTNFIDHTQITGYLRPVLHVSWPTLKIHNKHLNQSFQFNHKISLCPLQSCRLRQIISDSFWCILTARYQHCLFRIDLVNTADSPDNFVNTEIIIQASTTGSEQDSPLVVPLCNHTPQHVGDAV